MIKDLIKIANKLDDLGFKKEADELDRIISMAMEDPDGEGMMLIPEEDAGEEGAGEEPVNDSSATLEWITRGAWKGAQSDYRANEVFTGKMEDVDMRAMQAALNNDSEERGYYVIDPFNNDEFRTYVQGQQHHEDGRLIAVPLNTYLLPNSGRRLNYFKVNSWGELDEDKFGVVSEEAGE